MTYELRLRPFKRIFHPGTTMDKADWSLNGSYFETCDCETSCPCIWLQPPSEGNCTLLVGWHIESGHSDGQSLGDVNVALACYSLGEMKDGGKLPCMWMRAQITPNLR